MVEKTWLDTQYVLRVWLTPTTAVYRILTDTLPETDHAARCEARTWIRRYGKPEWTYELGQGLTMPHRREFSY
jgi:hypothetical protein